MKREVLTCDHCQKEESANGAVNWLQVRILGIAAQRADGKPINAEFCCDVCLVEYFKSRSSGPYNSF